MRTLIIGLDAFDPVVFERLYAQGRMPNLGKYVEAGGYARLAVSNPPQSEVSWTSLATGAGPGVHGLFDFVHRDPASYLLHVSLLPSRQGFAGVQFVRPHRAHTLFDQVAQEGFPATALWWPATFPARYESPVRTLPGLGTPDITGRLGVGTELSSDPGLPGGTQRGARKPKTRLERLERQGRDRYVGQLSGPSVQKLGRARPLTAEVQLSFTDPQTARVTIGLSAFELREGRWSPIVEVQFKGGLGVTLRAITRLILLRGQPEPRLYALPLQLHPLQPAWRYAAPPGLAKETWRACGPFLTLGWPQDTTGLDEGRLSDAQFLALCESIDDGRERILSHHLQPFREGVLASVFDTLDRVQHMFWRDRPDIVEAWYERLDALVGRIESALRAQADGLRLVIVSDHGFGRYDYKVHLNKWLIEHGYLAAGEDGSGQAEGRPVWSRTCAYAIGLNSLYLNLAGREGQGLVTGEERATLTGRLRDQLLQWRGPDGRPVVQRVQFQSEAFSGPLSDSGPDLVIGYSPGYRASPETGLGQWGAAPIEPNSDHWSGDHCFDPQAVPGVVFCNQGLADYAHPSYLDFPSLAIGRDLPHTNRAAPVLSSGREDEAAVEERLKSLGYL